MGAKEDKKVYQVKTTTLYRPVGQAEYDLIAQSGFKRFPPRLEWQPIFYPVMNQAYAEQIAFEWNTADDFSGNVDHVTAFDMPEDYLQRFAIQKCRWRNTQRVMDTCRKSANIQRSDHRPDQAGKTFFRQTS